MDCIRGFIDFCPKDRFWFIAVLVASIILGAFIENQFNVLRAFNRHSKKEGGKE